jgi:hypothetical protein
MLTYIRTKKISSKYKSNLYTWIQIRIQQLKLMRSRIRNPGFKDMNTLRHLTTHNS